MNTLRDAIYQAILDDDKNCRENGVKTTAGELADLIAKAVNEWTRSEMKKVYVDPMGEAKP